MTKSQQLSGLLSFLLLIGTPLTTLAADASAKQDDQKKSTTSLTLEDGGLTLSNQAGFSFGSKSIAEIIKGATTLKLSSETPLTIQDYHGTHEGWTLSVAMSKLTTTDGKKTIAQPTLTIIPTISTKDSQRLNDPSKTVVLPPIANNEGNAEHFGTQKTVLHAAENSGEGDTQLRFTDTTITIPKQYDISKGNYSADLQWTLVTGTPELRAAL